MLPVRIARARTCRRDCCPWCGYGVGREDFGLLGRNGGVALDDRGRDTTSGLDAERKGGDIEEVLNLLGVILEDGVWTAVS